jgi:hypothetical protein
MDIHEVLASALGDVLANSWSAELPPKPAWPALVYTVDSEPEKGWVLGGGYDQHKIEVIIFARARTELVVLKGEIFTIMEGLEGYMGDEAQGDAAYEPDPQVYAYVLNFVVRTRKESG